MRQKVLILFLSFLVGGIFFLPHLVIPNLLRQSGLEYSPFSFDSKVAQVGFEEMYAYAPEVQEVLRGNFPIRDAYSFEYQNYPTPFVGESLPAGLMALLAIFLGSVENAFIFGDFLFPVLIFLLLVKLLFSQTRSLAFSCVGTVVVMAFWDILYYLPYPLATLRYLWNPQTRDFLALSRSFNPQISFFVLLLAINAIFIALQPKAKLRNILFAAIACGLLFYTYAFYWMVLLLASGIFFVFLLFKHERRLATIVVLIGIGTVLIGSCYLLNSYLFSQTPLAKNFVLETTMPVKQLLPDFTFRYFIIALIPFLLKKKKTNFDLFIFAFILAASSLPFLTQLFLGRDLEKFHFIRRAFFPLGIVYWLLLIDDLLNRIVPFRARKIYLYISLFIFSLVIATLQQFWSSTNSYYAFAINKDRQNLYSWINSNLPASNVIGSADVVESLGISAYTKEKIFLPTADRSPIPETEMFNRLAILANLENIPKIEYDKWLDPVLNRASTATANGRMLTHILAFKLGSDIDVQRKLLNQSYLNLKNNQLVFPYRLDYVLVTPLDRKFQKQGYSSLLKPVYSNESYVLLKYISL